VFMNRSIRATGAASAVIAGLMLVGCTNPGGGGGTTLPPPTIPPGGGGGSYPKGPAPTALSIASARGSFATTQSSVAAGNGFGGGTIYSPTDTSQGTFGAVVLAPGFSATQSSVAWYGPLLASNGFVVFTIDTNTVLDLPDSRATQLLAAVNYLTGSSAARAKVDAARIAVGGWSMGGGGTLLAGQQRPTLKALFPMAEWGVGNQVGNVRIPTLVTSCQGDSVASNDGMSIPAYNSLAGPKAYNEVSGANHFCITSQNTTIGKAVLSFAKLYIDNDTRYRQFLTPTLGGGGSVVYRSSGI
jgi:hypothetical protein